MKKFIVSAIFLSLTGSALLAQSGYWQQKVNYVMNIDMDVKTNRFTGKQKLEYWNNSPDTLKRVFYHLYFNAFQPNSVMDQRSRHLGTMLNGNRPDWDGRVKDRIYNLKEDEIGYQKIQSLKMNGRAQKYKVQGTVLEVILDRPILPKTKATFDMDFEAQVPLQIRRSGRDNPNTKVRYSMSQWYPKMSEYDEDGWHPTPYVAREFYGVWGDFEVNISIDKNYILGGTGYLQNAAQIGYGYETAGTSVKRPAGDKLTWRFKADNVHDFMWAADPDYIHKSRKVGDVTFHVLYDKEVKDPAPWEKILDDAEKALPFIEKTFGEYSYKQYSFIHGGDGGMEYPMATLLAGTGAWLHEWMHNWYHGVLGFNESLYAWMDEGFTSYADSRIMAFLKNDDTSFAQRGNYNGYFALARRNNQEPLMTHSDHFEYNSIYSNSVYSKGAVFMEQLGYIIGDKQRDQLLLDFFNTWKFKHPDADDLVRMAEKKSDMKLDWYKEYWINTTKTIDYAFDSLWQDGSKLKIRVRRADNIPMPIDLKLTFKDGSSEMHYIPLDLMYGTKPAEDNTPRKIYEPWPWTQDVYVIESDKTLSDLKEAVIDPSLRMADVKRENNKITL